MTLRRTGDLPVRISKGETPKTTWKYRGRRKTRIITCFRFSIAKKHDAQKHERYSLISADIKGMKKNRSFPRSAQMAVCGYARIKI